MKPVKLSIAALSALSVLSLSGCAAFKQGVHPTTESSYTGEKERQFWADQTWREAISQQWSRNEQRLSRFRLSEFSK